MGRSFGHERIHTMGHVLVHDAPTPLLRHFLHSSLRRRFSRFSIRSSYWALGSRRAFLMTKGQESLLL